MLPISPAVASASRAPASAPAPHAPFGERLRVQGAPAPTVTGNASAATWTRAALEHVERARQRLDEALQAAQRGRTFTAQELLALQSQAYRYSQTIEVASKVVEQGVQAVKQAVQTQV